jgi:hypothetical protein
MQCTMALWIIETEMWDHRGSPARVCPGTKGKPVKHNGMSQNYSPSSWMFSDHEVRVHLDELWCSWFSYCNLHLKGISHCHVTRGYIYFWGPSWVDPLRNSVRWSFRQPFWNFLGSTRKKLPGTGKSDEHPNMNILRCVERRRTVGANWGIPMRQVEASQGWNPHEVAERFPSKSSLPDLLEELHLILGWSLKLSKMALAMWFNHI